MTDFDSRLAVVQLSQAVDQFNSGKYYDCHDTLEPIWMLAPAAEKPFYQGILQISVGLYHLGNTNWRGAVILLGEGINRLYAFEPNHNQIDVSHLIDQALNWLSALQQLGPDRVQCLAQQLPSSSAPNTEEKPEDPGVSLGIKLEIPYIQVVS